MSKFIPRKNVYDECERQQIAKAKSLVDLNNAKIKIQKLKDTNQDVNLANVLTSDELREVQRAVKYNMEIEE